jgi:hypothetical protein
MRDELNLDAPWAMGELAFEAICDELRAVTPLDSLVEFGAGRSSVRLAQAFPKADILSIESNAELHLKYLELRERHAPSSRLRIEHRPLRFQRHGAGLYCSFKPMAFPESVDAVIVDGPPEWTTRGREAAFYQVFDKLRVGGVVILDDASRPTEQQIVLNWLARYPKCFDFRYIDVDHGVAVLTKRRDVIAATAPYAVLDSLTSLRGPARRYLKTLGRV